MKQLNVYIRNTQYALCTQVPYRNTPLGLLAHGYLLRETSTFRAAVLLCQVLQEDNQWQSRS